MHECREVWRRKSHFIGYCRDEHEKEAEDTMEQAEDMMEYDHQADYIHDFCRYNTGEGECGLTDNEAEERCQLLNPERNYED